MLCNALHKQSLNALLSFNFVRTFVSVQSNFMTADEVLYKFDVCRNLIFFHLTKPLKVLYLLWLLPFAIDGATLFSKVGLTKLQLNVNHKMTLISAKSDVNLISTSKSYKP